MKDPVRLLFLARSAQQRDGWRSSFLPRAAEKLLQNSPCARQESDEAWGAIKIAIMS